MDRQQLENNKKVLTVPEFWEWRKAELDKGRRLLTNGTADKDDVLCYEFLSVNMNPKVQDEEESLVIVYNLEVTNHWVNSVFENLPYNGADYALGGKCNPW